MQIGEAFVGAGANAAHLNTILGTRDGPVGAAWAASLATPTAGHAPFMVVARPGVAVQPPTLFVSKSTLIASSPAARMAWGPAQAGVAGGVIDALHARVIDAAAVSTLVLIAAVWVDPDAADAALVYANNREATAAALAAGAAGVPTVDEVLRVSAPWNPFFSQDDH